jgi:hypothetical protein
MCTDSRSQFLPWTALSAVVVLGQAGVPGSSLRVGRAYRVSFQLGKDSLQGGLNDAGHEIWLIPGDSSQTGSKSQTLQQTSWGRFLRTIEHQREHHNGTVGVGGHGFISHSDNIDVCLDTSCNRHT